MTVAVYVRVSTKDQDVDMQLSAIKAYLSDVTHFSVYNDSGISGTTIKRPELQRLLKDVKDGKIQRVVIYKLDRLFRSLVQLVNTLEEWQSQGVCFDAVKDNIALGTPIGRLMMHILGAVAEFECSVTRERVRDGMKAARLAGVKLGRKRVYSDEDLMYASRATRYRRL